MSSSKQNEQADTTQLQYKAAETYHHQCKCSMSHVKDRQPCSHRLHTLKELCWPPVVGWLALCL